MLMLGTKILDTLKLGHDDVFLWHVQTLNGRKLIQNQKKYLKKRCSVCDSSYRTSCMKVLRGTSCVTRSPVLVLCCVSGGSGVTEVWRERRGTGQRSWNCDWRHVVITTHLRTNLDFSWTHSLFCVPFLSSLLCASLSSILHWHVLPELVLLLIRLALENQTEHDTALHHLAWWCHDVINTLLE